MTSMSDDDQTATDILLTVRQFKDRIYDYIPIHPRTCSFIDTKQFQRLRHVKQLGTSYYVWPGASHNRFEHCLGVAYLARRMVEHLRDSQPDLEITDREVECVELAGLCHDLGHGPFSHVWDNLFIPQALPGKKWKHEDASEMMFDDLVLKNNIDISLRDAKFVKALISGNSDRCSDPPEKPFLFEIVANKRNGIDVDKFDYIARDTNATGERTHICMTRLINSSRVIDNQICYNIKDANTLYEMCHTRFSLHKLIYTHKTARAIEYMIVDALLSANPYMQIAKQVDQPDKYVNLTDHVIQLVSMSTAPELEEARTILDRVSSRDLYKCVDYKVLSWDYKDKLGEYCTPDIIVNAAKTYVPKTAEEKKLVEELEAKHVIIDQAHLHHGMGPNNPLDKVKFYSKNHPNRCASAAAGDISSLQPAVFGEVLLRIYTRESRFFGIIQHGFRLGVLQVLENLSETAAGPPTPTATEAPSTPKPRSLTPKRTSSLSGSAFTTVNLDHHGSPTQELKQLKRRNRPEGMNDLITPKKKKRSA